jgi:hypothetical protein
MLRVAQEVPRARIAVGLGDSTGGLYNLEWINNEYVPPASMRRLFYVASQLKVRKAKPSSPSCACTFLVCSTAPWRGVTLAIAGSSARLAAIVALRRCATAVRL